MNTTRSLAQKLLHPEWGRPRQSPTRRVLDSRTHFYALTLHRSTAGSRTTHTFACKLNLRGSILGSQPAVASISIFSKLGDLTKDEVPKEQVDIPR